MVMGSSTRLRLTGGEFIYIQFTQKHTNVWQANNVTKLTINETYQNNPNNTTATTTMTTSTKPT